MIEPELFPQDLFPQDTASAPPVVPEPAADPAATAAPAAAPAPALPPTNDLHGRATPRSDRRLAPRRSGLSNGLLSESPPSGSPRGSLSHPGRTIRTMETNARPGLRRSPRVEDARIRDRSCAPPRNGGSEGA